MATSIPVCNVCDLRYLSNPSTVWCPECEEALCCDCREHHSLTRATRGHATIPISDYQKLPSFLSEIKQYCADHNEKYQQFCQIHECPLCCKCIQEHSGCGNVVPLDNVIENSKTSHVFHELTQSLLDLEVNVKRIRKDREDTLSDIKVQKEKCIDEVRQFRGKLNQHLDKLERQLIKELSNIEAKSNTQIKRLLNHLSKMETEVTDCQNMIRNIKQYASDLQTFLGVREIEQMVKRNEKNLQSLVESHTLDKSSLSCSIESKLYDILTKVQTFGSVQIRTKPSDVEMVSSRNKSAQMMVSKVRTINDLKFKLRLKVETYGEATMGCCILPDDTMLFTHYDYDLVSFLVVINAGGSIKYKIPLSPCTAVDVTFIDNKTVAVSSNKAGSYGINIVDLESKTCKLTLPGMDSCGVTYHNGFLVCCGAPYGMLRLSLIDRKVDHIVNDRSGTVLWPYVSAFGSNFYYTTDNSVTCCDEHGRTIWKAGGQSTLEDPRGISVDNNGNVYVVDRKSSNVVVISPDGKYLRQILSMKDGINTPNAVFYDKIRHRLLVANYKGSAYLFDVL